MCLCTGVTLHRDIRVFRLKYENTLKELKMIINTNPVKYGAKLQHVCHPEVCNCCGTRETRNRMGVLLSQTMFGKRLRSPQLKEWTAVGDLKILLSFA